MKGKEIWVIESQGAARVAEPVTVSVPLSRGELPPGGGVRLIDAQGRPCPVQWEPVMRWPDGSVKWLLCHFAASAPPLGRALYTLSSSPEPSPLPVGIEVGSGKEAWRVDTGAGCFLVDTRRLIPFASFVRAGELGVAAGEGLQLTLADGTRHGALVESLALERRGGLRTTLLLKGRFQAPARALFSCRLHFYAGRSTVSIELTLRNPSAARHPGGLWDLGDPASLVFRELAWGFPAPNRLSPQLVLIPLPGAPRMVADPAEGLSIRQLSSGGRMRLSPNHRTPDGRCYASSHGYLVKTGERQLREGDRALPSLWYGSGEKGVLAVLPRFWQEFPKGLSARSETLSVELFPADSPAPHELQGGEQKTTCFAIDFASPPEAEPWLRFPLCALASPEACRAAGVLRDLPPLTGEGEDLVDRFLSSPEDLLARREEIDEYGWRHFGEVYADHEAVRHRGEGPFVSHYNNQYDLCAGLYRKFLATGDPHWQELAADLARHVLDIDLYHTAEDREEYNGGLFWHTEHYLPAGLATHRTFSREHLSERDPAHYGGGPAAEHCYSSGLLMHYLFTGNRDYREATLELADWCYRSLAGGTVLGAIHRSLAYLSGLRDNGGAPFPRYPLTRGTGNALNAALDAFLVSADHRYLSRAEELVRQALHPGDDIEARNLLEPEVAWSYTVLLAALARFLDLKAELEETDAGYAYAREALLAYARWMVPHEYPYLRRPEKLEYPNETWAAQELRKSAVLHHAARYAQGEERGRFLAKARELTQAAVADLTRFPTSACTRPLALMLQNGWVSHALSVGLAPGAPPAAEPVALGTPTPSWSALAVTRRIICELKAACRESSLKRELAWLSARLRSRRGR